MKTLVVNLYGGPGISKSTTAALVFGKLKVAGVNAELITEYAKDLTWEDRQSALVFQPYVAAKQMFRVHRVLGKVDVAITDSPILLSTVYKGESYTPAFEAFLLDTYAGWNTLNIQLLRNSEAHPYKQVGRKQNEDEATSIDRKIDRMLRHHRIPRIDLVVGESEATAEKIVELTLQYLKGEPVSAVLPAKSTKKELREQMLEVVPA